MKSPFFAVVGMIVIGCAALAASNNLYYIALGLAIGGGYITWRSMSPRGG